MPRQLTSGARAPVTRASGWGARPQRLAAAGMRRVRGVSLIEVLVAILIVSLGLLALAGLLNVSSRVAKTSEYRATAAQLAADMVDRMRANRAGATAGNYSQAPSALSTAKATQVSCANVTSCTAEEIANQDKAEWNTLVFNALPGGTGYIDYTGTSGVGDLWIIWTDPNALNESSSSDNRLIYGTANGCPGNFSTSTTVSCMYFRLGL